jgi:hypothetical protein
MVSLDELRALSNPAPAVATLGPLTDGVSAICKLPFRGDLVEPRHVGRRVSRRNVGLEVSDIGMVERTREKKTVSDDDMYASMGVDFDLCNGGDSDPGDGNSDESDEDNRDNEEAASTQKYRVLEGDTEEAEAAARLRAADDHEDRQASAVAFQKVQYCTPHLVSYPMSL